MKDIFLESHNIKNMHFGFGQFNYHLIKGLHHANITDFKMTFNLSKKNLVIILITKNTFQFVDIHCFKFEKNLIFGTA